MDKNETIAHNSPSGATDWSHDAAARPTPPVAADPGTRGLTIETCDMGHQAIAFAGTCPLCRRKANYVHQGAPPADEGHMIYAADLDRMLRRHYGAGGGGARH